MAITVEELKQKAINLGQTGLNMAQTGVDKGIQLASVAKLKALNVKEEANLRAAYAELGRLYFADHGTEPEDAYASVCSQITDIQAAIAANNAKIAELKVAPEAAEAAETPATEEEIQAAVDEAESIVDQAAAAFEESIASGEAAPADDEAAPI